MTGGTTTGGSMTNGSMTNAGSDRVASGHPRAKGRIAGLLTLASLVGTISATTPVEAPVADAAERGDLEEVRTLLRQGADQIMKMSLELGGNAPFIVFDDADLDAAVEGAPDRLPPC